MAQGSGFDAIDVWSTAGTPLEIHIKGNRVILVNSLQARLVLPIVSMVLGLVALFLLYNLIAGRAGGVGGGAALIVLILVFAGLSVGVWWASRLSRSRLSIAIDGGHLRASGPRWSIPAGSNPRAESVEFGEGIERRHGETLDRLTWRVFLGCSADAGDGRRTRGRLVVLEGWPAERARAKAERLAQAADLPLTTPGGAHLDRDDADSGPDETGGHGTSAAPSDRAR